MLNFVIVYTELCFYNIITLYCKYVYLFTSSIIKHHNSSTEQALELWCLIIEDVNR